MSEEDKVLINRTYYNRDKWKRLKFIAELLTERGEPTTREELVNHGLDATVRYYEQKLKLKSETLPNEK